MKILRWLIPLILSSLVLIIGYVYSTDIKLSGEETVALHCVTHTYWDLLKPSNGLFQGCTVDHMPLHHVLVKFLFPFFEKNLFYYRMLSVLFGALSMGVLSFWMLRDAVKASVLTSILLCLVIISGEHFIFYYNFIRVYSLYFLTAAVSLYFFEIFFDRPNQKNCMFLCISYAVGFLNYFVHAGLLFVHLPFIWQKIKNDRKTLIPFIMFLIGFLTYFLIKLYYVVSWRFIVRAKDSSIIFDIDSMFNFFFSPFTGESEAGLSFYLLILIAIVSVVMTSVSCIKKRHTKNLTLIVLAIGTITTFFFLKYSLNLMEIEFRYFMFLPIVSSVLIVRTSESWKWHLPISLCLLFVLLNRDYDARFSNAQYRSYVLSELIEYTQEFAKDIQGLPVYSRPCCYYEYYLQIPLDYHNGITLPDLSGRSVRDIRETYDEVWVLVFENNDKRLLQQLVEDRFTVQERFSFPIPFDGTSGVGEIVKIKRNVAL